MGGGGLSLGWHCGVTYQILGLYVNLFSHKEFFAKLIWVGGAGGGLVWVGTMVSHRYQISGLYVNPFSHKEFLQN